MQLSYIKHEQNECVSPGRKEKTTKLCCCHAPRQPSVRPQTLMWWLCFGPFSSTVVQFLPESESWADVSLKSTFISSLIVLWAFAKHPGCSFPFVCVQCCAFDLCCAQLFSLLIIRCLSSLKKARRLWSEVKCKIRSLACFLLLVFQWEASWTNLMTPALFYTSWHVLTKWWQATSSVLNELIYPQSLSPRGSKLPSPAGGCESGSRRQKEDQLKAGFPPLKLWRARCRKAVFDR